mgnify:CR=1 FL=1
MKYLPKGYILIHEDEFDARLNEAYDDAVQTEEFESAKRAEKAEAELEKRDAAIGILKRKSDIAKAQIAVLEEEREEVRAMVTKDMELQDMQALLTQREELLNKKEDRLKDRLNEVTDEEEGQYKRGYADGVADGVREIHNVTSQDRENAMKVAMVAAASHTSAEVVKELNNNVKSITGGTEDK